MIEIMESGCGGIRAGILYKEGVEKIGKIKEGNWIDLRAEKEEHLYPGDFKLISLGIAMAFPFGYEALIIPRSSLFKKHGIIQANSVGLIDESYRGDADIWMFPAYATRETIIEKNERICQFRLFKKQGEIHFDEVPTLGCRSRGGFGSTGKF